MFIPAAKAKPAWSTIGLRVLVACIAAIVLLILLDGIMKGPIAFRYAIHDGHGTFTMLATWIVDLRYLAEQGVYAATIFFVGAKFFETRSVFTIGFDKLDADKVVLNGPDENNVVWIGHRYPTRLEAETIAIAFEERLKQSAA